MKLYVGKIKSIGKDPQYILFKRSIPVEGQKRIVSHFVVVTILEYCAGRLQLLLGGQTTLLQRTCVGFDRFICYSCFGKIPRDLHKCYFLDSLVHHFGLLLSVSTVLQHKENGAGILPALFGCMPKSAKKPPINYCINCRTP